MLRILFLGPLQISGRRLHVYCNYMYITIVLHIQSANLKVHSCWKDTLRTVSRAQCYDVPDAYERMQLLYQSVYTRYRKDNDSVNTCNLH